MKAKNVGALQEMMEKGFELVRKNENALARRIEEVSQAGERILDQVEALQGDTGSMETAPIAARLTDFVQDVRFEDVRGVGINDANYAVIERLAHWQAALQMWRYNLWTGVGFGCYEPAYRDFALINWPIALGHAHNYYLNIAAETGLIGLAAYLFLWGAVFWHTWRATRRAKGLLRGVAIGLLGTWTHLTVHHFLDNLYVNNIHLHIGALLGLLAFVVRETGREEPCEGF